MEKGKYREAILAILLFCAVIFSLLFWIMNVNKPVAVPDAGIWYCEDLDMTLDCSQSPIAVSVRQEEQTEIYFFHYDKFGDCYWYDAEQTFLGKHGSIHMGTFLHRNTLYFNIEDTTYRFYRKYK